MFTQLLLVFSFWMNNASVAYTYSTTNPQTDIPAKSVDNYISWSSDRKLTWNDFQKEADVNNPLHAMTATHIAVNVTCENGKLVSDVKCRFTLTDSWTKDSISVALLQHEQLHFDLTEVYARQLRQKLSQQKNLCGTNSKKFNAVVNKVFAD